MSKQKRQPPKRPGGMARLVFLLLQQCAGPGGVVLWLLGLFSMVGATGYFAWREAAPLIRQRDEYQLTAERITLTPPPAWIRTDVKFEVLRDTALARGLSILDPNLVQILRDAFEMHPWIERVHQIQRAHPARVTIEVTYRRPIATLQIDRRQPPRLIPIDIDAFRLPDADLPDTLISLLPHIRGNYGESLVGQPYRDPRVLGAARLAAWLAGYWRQLHLVDIVPSTRPERDGDQRYFNYEIVTAGQTRIRWGAAPGLGPQQEAPPQEKLARLLTHVENQGPLNTLDAPAVIDVRSDLRVIRQTAAESATTGESGVKEIVRSGGNR